MCKVYVIFSRSRIKNNIKVWLKEKKTADCSKSRLFEEWIIILSLLLKMRGN